MNVTLQQLLESYWLDRFLEWVPAQQAHAEYLCIDNRAPLYIEAEIFIRDNDLRDVVDIYWLSEAFIRSSKS